MSRRSFLTAAAGVFVLAGIGFCASLESNWGDFIHYTAIGRSDLAKAYGEALLQSNPDPLQLLALSDENPDGYALLEKYAGSQNELQDVSKKIMAVIEQGRYMRRTDPKIINEEIARLSGTARGRLTALDRLKNAGEYAVVYMVAAMEDPARKEELPNIIWALPQLGKGAVEPLIAALQVNDPGIKIEIMRALGQMKYPESLGYIKYYQQTSDNPDVKNAAIAAIAMIDPSAANLPSNELFYQLGEAYYRHAESLTPPAEANSANVWFWDAKTQGLTRQKVDTKYYNELMAMRACEWSLKADPNTGKAIGLWIGSFFKAESTDVAMPEYFGPNHASAMTYAKTAGPEYLHQALARALKNKETFIVLNVVEALNASAGEKSLMYTIGGEQPLMDALSYNDKAVQYSAALAIASARPAESFAKRDLVAKYLASALLGDANGLTAEQATGYSKRAMLAIYNLAQTRNRVIDLLATLEAVVKVANDSGKAELQLIAINTLGYIESPDAQRALAALALNDAAPEQTKLVALASLAMSAKMNANLLTDEQINGLYAIVSSTKASADLRSGAAAAYGALNLPSSKVNRLILDQSKD